jgi:hypothetical protein
LFLFPARRYQYCLSDFLHSKPSTRHQRWIELTSKNYLSVVNFVLFQWCRKYRSNEKIHAHHTACTVALNIDCPSSTRIFWPFIRSDDWQYM